MFAVGGSGSADGKASRGSFNALSSNDLSSTGHSGSAVMPYVYGFGGDAPDGGYNGRGSLASGANGAGTSYQGAGSFNPMTGASEGGGYDGRGVLAFTRGIAGGFGGWEGQEYTGPYGETTIDYTYGDVNGEYPHAVTARSNGDTFTYDAVGNMTRRTQGGVTWTQVFDAENRLVSVGNGTSTTTYVYDGSGGRLKRIVDDGVTVTTTLYIGNMEIEKVGSTETQRTLYYGNAFRIIGGANPGLYFMHGDHLGSVSVISDANGMKVGGSDVVYAPFGDVRSSDESELTDFGYTSQRSDDGTGDLMYYRARYYLPGIQHFISADTIVMGKTSQALNRYSYVLNNPVRFNDPTGHAPSECVYCMVIETVKAQTSLKETYGVNLTFKTGSIKERFEMATTTLGNVRTMAKNVFQAVQTHPASSLPDTIKAYAHLPSILQASSASEAFKEAVGAHSITVYEGSTIIADVFDKDANGKPVKVGTEPKTPCLPGHTVCYYGYNHGPETRPIGLDIIRQNYFQSLPVNFTTQGAPQLLAHEFGHTLAWDQTYSDYDSNDNQLKVDGDRQTVPTTLGGVASHSADTPPEYSANIAGAFLLGTIDDPARRKHVQSYIFAQLGL